LRRDRLIEPEALAGPRRLFRRVGVEHLLPAAAACTFAVLVRTPSKSNKQVFSRSWVATRLGSAPDQVDKHGGLADLGMPGRG
jgi:hypothetical protein